MNSRINKNWNRWIMSSVYDHFKKGCSPIKINFDNEDPITPPTVNRLDSIEFKHLGPDFDYKTQTECIVYITVNLMVVTFMDKREPFRHLNNIGLAQSLFTNCLGLYKYGPYKETDDGSLFNSLDLISHVRSTNFGAFDSVTRVLRTTVEGTYSADLEGDVDDDIQP